MTPRRPRRAMRSLGAGRRRSPRGVRNRWLRLRQRMGEVARAGGRDAVRCAHTKPRPGLILVGGLVPLGSPEVGDRAVRPVCPSPRAAGCGANYSPCAKPSLRVAAPSSTVSQRRIRRFAGWRRSRHFRRILPTRIPRFARTPRCLVRRSKGFDCRHGCCTLRRCRGSVPLSGGRSHCMTTPATQSSMKRPVAGLALAMAAVVTSCTTYIQPTTCKRDSTSCSGIHDARFCEYVGLSAHATRDARGHARLRHRAARLPWRGSVITIRQARHQGATAG
jgi:hypothetical protein